MLLGSVSSSQALQRWTRQLSGPDPTARTGPRLGVRAAAAFFLALLFLTLWRTGLLPAESVQALIVLCAIEVLSLPVYLYFFKRFQKRTLQAYCHWVTDILLITVGIHYLGGEQAFLFSFTYCLVILSTSMVARKRDSFILAGLSALAFGTLLYLEGTGTIVQRGVWNLALGSSERVLFPIWSVAFFFLTAYFSSLLSDRLRERGRILETVNAISRVSASSLELEGMLSRVLSFVLEHLKAEYGLIRLTNHWPEKRMVSKETRRVPEDLTESEREALERLVEMLLGENEPVIIRDLTTDPRSRPDGDPMDRVFDCRPDRPQGGERRGVHPLREEGDEGEPEEAVPAGRSGPSHHDHATDCSRHRECASLHQPGRGEPEHPAGTG